MAVKKSKDVISIIYKIRVLLDSITDEDFEELPEDLKDAIILIEEKYPQMTTHIGYNLMILKQDLQNERNN